MQGSVEVKGRESSHTARHRSTGGVGVLDGVSWRPLRIVCPTWNGEGRTAEAALAVGGMAGRRVGEGSGAGLHSGGLHGSDGEVCYTSGREHTGRRRAMWPSGERSARGAGSGRAKARATRARAQRGAGAAEVAHMAGQCRWRAAEEKQRRERGR
jgi:hypothetical protein